MTACAKPVKKNNSSEDTSAPRIKSITAKRYAKKCIDYIFYEYNYGYDWQQNDELALDDYKITTYDAQGRIVSERSYDADGMEIGYRKYNDEGQVYEEEYLVGIQDSYSKFTYVYEYNEDGNKVKSLIKGADNTFYEMELFIYDSEGNLTDHFSEDYDIGYKYHYKLDINGECIYRVIYLSNSWEYWNNNDALIESVYFYNNNTEDNIPNDIHMSWWEKNEYDEPTLKFHGTYSAYPEGEPMRSVTSLSYEYDNYGNVVKETKTNSSTGEIIEVVEYEIEYYTN